MKPPRGAVRYFLIPLQPSTNAKKSSKMRRSKTESLADVITDYIRALGIEQKIAETAMIKRWEEFVGKYTAQSTTKLTIHQGTLYVSLGSSVLRNELTMIREGLKDKINREMGAEIIQNIVFR
ncbi:MAG: hypothetical protein RIS47_733 [Bacteroidota bacterium]|jgi:predicted nucleic acid-binding Zn ribbon protein